MVEPNLVEPNERRYVDVPGSATHELPPLLVHAMQTDAESLHGVVDIAAGLIEVDDMLPTPEPDQPRATEIFEQRKFDLALHLTDSYMRLLSHWQWGDSILEWIRQCEITFESRRELRHLLHPDVWPHAARSSFVTLLADKAVPTHGVGLEKAVGLRLTFRQPPPIECFSNQFLFYLNSTVADSAYHTWANLSQELPSLLPPHRFYFQVHELSN